MTPGFSTYEHTDMKPVRGANKREYGGATAEEKLAAVRKDQRRDPVAARSAPARLYLLSARIWNRLL